MNDKLLVGTVMAVVLFVVISVSANLAERSLNQDLMAKVGSAFDQYGYNRTARIFNGTGSSWCVAGGQLADCVGAYSPDKLIMKWTADWDRGKAEGWSGSYPNAWLSNEWNGKGVANGSGAVWHYKIKWVGDCVANPALVPTGGYCIWGQFATIMDQGIDPSLGPGHIWFAKALPNGYGTGQ